MIPNSKVSKYHLVTERFLRRAIAELSTASKNQTESTRIATPQTGLMSILPWVFPVLTIIRERSGENSDGRDAKIAAPVRRYTRHYV